MGIFKSNKITVKDVVTFQAYDDATPIQGRVIEMGTLKELNRLCLDEDDKRIFYVLETIGKKPESIFTCTTAMWITKSKFVPERTLAESFAILESNPDLMGQFREIYGSTIPMIKACIKDDLVKPIASKFIHKLANTKS